MADAPEDRAAGAAGAAPPSLQRHRLELVLVLLFLLPIYFPLVLSSIAPEAFAVVAIATMLHDVALTALILFFLWSSGERRASIGWTPRRLGREVALGVVLYVPMTGLAALLAVLLHDAGLTSPSSPPLAGPRSPSELVLAAILVVVVACAEETIFRGFLIQRLRDLTRSTTAAVVLSTALFAIGHASQGSAGVVDIAVIGLVLALVYLWRRSLVAPIVMHFLQDFIALVVVPWVGLHR